MTNVELHPEFLTKNGQREFAVLTYKEFLALEEWLEDASDLLEIRDCREADSRLPNVTLDEVEKEFGIQ